MPLKYSPPRKNDFFIMEKIHASTMSDEYKQIFNEVRLSMNIVTASDLVELQSGTKVLASTYNGVNDRKSKWTWPQHVPFHKTMV